MNRTVLAQVAAEEFGTTMDKVKVIHTDTANTPYDWATVSTRITYHVGNALRLACQDARQQILELASKKMGIETKYLEIKMGEIRSTAESGVAIKITDLFMPGGYLAEGGEIIGKATYTCPRSSEDPETGLGERLVAYHSYGASAAEVAVNTETGEVKLLKVGGCFDMGRALNPKLCEAQLEGGMGMGIGSAIYEEINIEGGKVVNPTFTDYRMPTFEQMPSLDDTKISFAPVPHREGPYGAKGVGEVAIVPVAPAIASAVYDAIKVRIKDLPLTAEKCLKYLEGSNQGVQR